MELNRLLQQVMVRMPAASAADTFRMAMLLSHTLGHSDGETSGEVFELAIDQRMQDISLQLSVHEDQHAAIADDLDSLASTEPCQFNVQHLWTLVRAIKVQSQLLGFYLGPQSVATSSR